MHLCMVSFLFINQSFAQSNEGSLNGNFQIGGQYYVEDDANEAQVPEQLIGFNLVAITLLNSFFRLKGEVLCVARLIYLSFSLMVSTQNML